MKLIIAVTLFLTVLQAAPSRASVVTWTATGNVTGSFGYDATNNVFTAVSLFGDDEFHGALASSTAFELDSHGSLFNDDLRMLFGNALTNAGGTIAYGGTFTASFGTFPINGSVSAPVAAVPEPANVALMTAGLFLLIAFSRHRRSSAPSSASI